MGLYAATRVHNTADYAVAGRSLPLAVVIATTFATWFGSETVLGVSARFIDGNLGAVVEDPKRTTAVSASQYALKRQALRRRIEPVPEIPLIAAGNRVVGPPQGCTVRRIRQLANRTVGKDPLPRA